MHRVLKKHVNARDTYASDFTDLLDVGETISNATIVITRNKDGADGISELLESGTTQILAGVVSFELKPRQAPDEQATGIYVIEVQAPTSNGRTLVDEWHLFVHDEP